MKRRCKNCGNWDIPLGWKNWISHAAGGKKAPYNWDTCFCHCKAVLDLSHVDLHCYVDGNASTEHELDTRGDFGCVLWKKRES